MIISAYIEKIQGGLFVRPVLSDGLRQFNFGKSPYSVKIERITSARTYKQNNTIWALVSIIWQAQNGNAPTESQKYSLYMDIIDAYSDKVKNKLTGVLRPIHISEADTQTAAKIVNACFEIAATCCDLPLDSQASVQSLFKQWQQWRGQQIADPLDCDNLKKWKQENRLSHASGIGGLLECAHIVSRGARPDLIDNTANLLMLTHNEHMLQHEIGWDEFLKIYPHLTWRVERAKNL